MKLLRGTYNELLAVSGSARSVIGVWKEGSSLAFRLFPGRFEKELLRRGEASLYASFSSAEYADFSIFKELPFCKTPIGVGPCNWYLAFKCKLNAYIYSEPASLVYCEPSDAFARPAEPPRRAFFFIVEALIKITRLHLGENKEEVLRLLREAGRLGDEEDKRVVKKLLQLLLP